MKVVINPEVFDILDDFYRISRDRHITLSLETCLAKIDRLETAIMDFAKYAEILHSEPYRDDWKKKGYNEFIAEDFHFAYKIYVLPDGEKVLRIHDAVHSLLNH